MNQTDVVDAFKPDLSRKYGCAWFVWGNEGGARAPEKTGGWASIGGDPAFQFHNPNELPKDIIWWTNLSKPEAWSLGRWSHIKHAGFLGPHWLSLMSEWGFPSELEDLKIACSAWSEILARLGNVLTRWNAQHNPKSPAKFSAHAWEWGDGDFHEVLAEKLGWTTQRVDANPILQAAFCDVVENEVAPNLLNGKRKMTLTLPRVEHARQILATRYPVGEFTEVPVAEWAVESEQRWEWLRKQIHPVLLRFDDITYRAGHEAEAQLWWGLRGRRFAGAMMEPVWLTGEEALEMCFHTEATPMVALRSKGWTRLNDVAHWPNPNMGFAYDNSIVGGLLHEALWRAAATPSRTPTKRIKSGVSARAVWWRSADRRACYSVALQFQQKGFTVVSYGEGCITVVFDPKIVLVADWVDVLEHTEVRVPRLLGENMRPPHDITAHNIDVWLKSSQDIQAWLKLDRLLWPTVGHNAQEWKSVLELALRSLAAVPPPQGLNGDEAKKWSSQWKDELMKCSRTALKDAVKNAPGYKQNGSGKTE